MAWVGSQPMDGFRRQWSVQRGGWWLGEPAQSIEGGPLICLPPFQGPIKMRGWRDGSVSTSELLLSQDSVPSIRMEVHNWL